MRLSPLSDPKILHSSMPSRELLIVILANVCRCKVLSSGHIVDQCCFRFRSADVLSSLLTPEASANATLRVSSIDNTASEIISAISSIANKSIQATYIPLEEFKKQEETAWKEEAPNATVYTLSRIWYEGGSDFTKKPRALYLKDGKEVEDKQLEEQLFKDVPKPDLKTVLKALL
jgi:hypothetical protein